MKKLFSVFVLVFAFVTTSSAQNSCCGKCVSCDKKASTVYVTRDITPESLIQIYKALGRPATGRVCVKISTGESEKTGYLRPAFIKPLIDEVHGTIVECNTAYGGTRNTTEKHLKVIKERGFDKIAKVDIMDSEDTMRISVQDTAHIKYDIVGSHLKNYDFMINLAHFKGHQMGGFGGVMKNASIGVASSSGKAYIHSAGVTDDVNECWKHIDDQDGFVESMASAAQGVHNFFDGGKKILYIAVMNNMSIDCDCNGDPAKPEVQDYGILASLDPVALDQACYDILANMPADAKNNPKPFLDRVAKQHGTLILTRAEQNGLGTKKYTLVNLK